MVYRGKKRNFKGILFGPKLLSLVGLAVIILISFPLAKNAVKQYRINKEINGLKEEIALSQNKGADLKNLIADLNSYQYIEEQARLNFNLKKPGEELIVITNNGSAQSLASSSEDGIIFDIPGYRKAE